MLNFIGLVGIIMYNWARLCLSNTYRPAGEVDFEPFTSSICCMYLPFVTVSRYDGITANRKQEFTYAVGALYSGALPTDLLVAIERNQLELRGSGCGVSILMLLICGR